MDVLRCFALLCVVCTHFFLNSGFYDQIVEGRRMLFMVCLRSFFMICVPLFLMLSGYLMNRKKVSASYYKKLIPLVGGYLLSCGACILYRFLFHRDDFSVYRSIRGIFNFYASEYGWYMKMYLGLFLLIPFLNGMYHSLDSRQEKRVLLLSLILLTAAPSLLNIWRFNDRVWWSRPASSSDYDLLIPDWWKSFYPVSYYIAGCYLREFPLKLKRSTALLLSGGLFVLSGLFNFYRSYSSVFLWGPWADHGSAFVMAQSILLFHLIAGMRQPREISPLGKLSAYFSGLCMNAYLCSCIFDDAFYELLSRLEPRMHYRLYYFPLIVLAVYLCSLSLSAVLNGIYNMTARLFHKLSHK
jgi:surface polysaccharide O-acyltransferase-like enzyme